MTVTDIAAGAPTGAVHNAACPPTVVVDVVDGLASLTSVHGKCVPRLSVIAGVAGEFVTDDEYPAHMTSSSAPSGGVNVGLVHAAVVPDVLVARAGVLESIARATGHRPGQ